MFPHIPSTYFKSNFIKEIQSTSVRLHCLLDNKLHSTRRWWRGRGTTKNKSKRNFKIQPWKGNRETDKNNTVMVSLGVSIIKGNKWRLWDKSCCAIYLGSKTNNMMPHVVVTAEQNQKKKKKLITHYRPNYLKVEKDHVKVARRMLLMLRRWY